MVFQPQARRDKRPYESIVCCWAAQPNVGPPPRLHALWGRHPSQGCGILHDAKPSSPQKIPSPGTFWMVDATMQLASHLGGEKKKKKKRTGDTPKKSAAGLLGVVGGALGVVELCATLTNEVCRRAAGLPNRERRLDDGIWRADGKEGKKRGSSFSLLERERERENPGRRYCGALY